MLGARAIDNRVSKISELEAEKKRIEAEIDAIKDELKADMKERGVDEMSGAKFIVRFKEIVSNRFDSSAFKKSYGELYKTFTKTSSSERFTWAAI